VSDHILHKQDGPILEITLNRPEIGNAATDEMATTVTHLVGGAVESAQLIVIRGAGDDFCVGRETMTRPRRSGDDTLERRRDHDTVFNCYSALRNSVVPVVGVVQGRARGFGCAIAALCDLTIASEGASFQVPEMSHNIFPTMVMSALVDRVPLKAFNHLIYTTAVIDAERARQVGIVSDVVPAAQLEETVEATCAAILKASPSATRAVKEFARSAFDMDVAGAVDYARNLHVIINASAEVRSRRNRKT
jgi:enoyl-CoA hydratase